MPPVDRADEHVPKDREPGDFQSAPLATRLRLAPMTAGLLGLIVALFALTLAGTLAEAPDPAASALRSLWSLDLEESKAILLRLGALELSHVWLDNQWWRVLSTSLLHGSLIHLALNATALLSVSEWIEHECGRLHTLGIFLIGSLGGGLASLVWCESPVVLGASAGILGQAGALWLARVFGSSALRARLAPISPASLGVLILLCLLLGLVVPGIAQAGHVGGFLAGSLAAGAWLARSHLLRFGLLLSLGAMLLDLAWVGSEPTGRTGYYQILGSHLREEGRTSEALNLFNRGLAFDPTNANFRNEIAYQYAKDGVELEYAERLALEALALDPANAAYLDTLAWIWCRQGDPVPALRLLNASLYLSDEPSDEVEGHLGECASAGVFHVEHSGTP